MITIYWHEKCIYLGNMKTRTMMIHTFSIAREASKIKAVELSSTIYLRLFIAVFAFLTGLFVIFVSVNSIYLADRFLWNTTIGNVDVGGMNWTEAQHALLASTERYKKEKLVLTCLGEEYSITNGQIGVQFDIDESLKNAVLPSAQRDELERMNQRFFSLWTESRHALSMTILNDSLEKILTATIPYLDSHRTVDAAIETKNGQFVVTPEKPGLTFPHQEVVRQLNDRFGGLSNSPIEIQILKKNPDITVQHVQMAISRFQKLINTYVRMYYDYDGYSHDEWSFLVRDHRDWVRFSKIQSGSGFELVPLLKPAGLHAHLAQRIASYLYRPQENITIESDNGMPRIIGTAKDGCALDIRATILAINDSIRHSKARWGVLSVPLRVKKLDAIVTNPDNVFGLSEILAVGMTDFFGSPDNRKFNIQHAAPRFHNLIVPSDSQFSFVRAMGPVDSLHGYRKELIIVNGDSTEPQWGGGICQLSSTLYRAVLFSGLEIIHRTSHSFEVKYYQPAGLDATVFDPAPDFVFKNDTPGNLLIQNYVDMERTKMVFVLIGKRDGRTVECTGPVEEGLFGDLQDKYAFSWTRDITFGDGSQRQDKFLSVYKNKHLVKKHQPAAASEPVILAANR